VALHVVCGGRVFEPVVVALSMWLEGPRAQVLRGSEGIITVSAIVAALILLAGLPSVLFCKEKIAEHRGEAKIGFLRAAS